MKVLETTGSTSVTDKVIEKAISALIIHKDGAVGSETLSLKKVSKQGGAGVTIISNIKLIDLFEIAAQSEGSFYNKTAAAYGLVHLGINGAAIELQDNEYLVLSLSNLTSNKVYKIFGAESPVSAPFALVYEKVTVTSGTESRKMQVGNAHAVVLPHAGLVQVDVTYINGNLVRQYPEELTALSGAANDLVSIEEAGVVYGSKNLHSLTLDKALNFEVFTDGNGYTFYTVSAQQA